MRAYFSGIFLLVRGTVVTSGNMQNTPDAGVCYGEKPGAVGTGSTRGGWMGMRFQGNIEQNPKGGERRMFYSGETGSTKAGENQVHWKPV